MIALAYIIFAAVIVVLLLFCYSIVRYYQDKHESEALPTLVTVMGMALTLMCVALIPVDIYSVSSSRTSNGDWAISPEDMEMRSTGLRSIYYILYSVILVFTFALIPFAYFYYEEDGENTTLRAKVWSGMKYTIFLVLFVLVLFAIGMIVWSVNNNGANLPPASTDQIQQWLKNQLNENIMEAALSFAVAGLTTIGYVSWITYTAYGFSAFPLGLIKGNKNIEEEQSGLADNMESTRADKKKIQSKYLGGKRISRADEAKINLLNRREKVLSRQANRLDDANTACAKCLVVFTPFKFIFGIVFGLVSLLIVVSILLTNIDRAINSGSLCSGASCGFAVVIPDIVNPIDFLMTKVSPYFPVDYVFLAALVVYIFFATLNGVVRVGVRFIWYLLYKVKAHRTVPQGMLLMAVILMFSTLALNMEITTIAPQYSNWGSQQYFGIDPSSNTTKLMPCSMNAPPANCTMTQIATFINRINVKTPFFGVIFYIMNWVFLVMYVIGAFVALCKSRASNIEEREDDEDEDEDF